MGKRKPAQDVGAEAPAPAVFMEAPPPPLALRWDDPLHPKGVEYHPSGRPVVRYGPPPQYPQGEDEESLCAAIVSLGAEGYTFHAIALKLGMPPATLASWATKPYGAKLRDAIGLADQYARGSLEAQARDNVDNAKFNTALWGKVMASRFPEYRAASGGGRIDDDGNPVVDGATEQEKQQEFERRLLSTVDRLRRGEIGAAARLIEQKDESE